MKKKYNVVDLSGKPLFKWKGKLVKESYFWDKGEEIYMCFVQREDGEIYHCGFALLPSDPIVHVNHWSMIWDMFYEKYNIKVIA